MKKVIKFILSWNWSFLFWFVYAVYWIQKFSDPALLEKVPFQTYGAAALVCMSIVLLCDNVVKMALRHQHKSLKIPPPESVCPVISADRALYYFVNTQIEIIYMKDTSVKYHQTGYYKRGEYSWILLES